MLSQPILQVNDVQEEAGRLRAAYAGDKAREIDTREQEVVDAWNNLNSSIKFRCVRLDQTDELFRFLNLVRALMMWMEDILLQIINQDKAR